MLANISLDVKDNVAADSIKQIVTDLTEQIKQRYPLVKRVFIEFESQDKHTACVQA